MTKEERQIEQGLRLQKFYKSLNLKGIQFAAQVGVTQSLISGVSSGRKPITHQLIQKITERYPNFNEGWLRTGYGSMEFQLLELSAAEEPAHKYLSAWDAFDVLRGKMEDYERRIANLEALVAELRKNKEE
jgi:transcriptional regulator with XRE-family HTH domain